jgi:fatty aldehyde-generating acyl-ACP reductase
MENKFAFVCYPVQPGCIRGRLGIMRGLPARPFEQILLRLPPLTLSTINGVKTPHSETEGLIISSNVTTAQAARLPEAYIVKKLIRAARKAASLGARIIGLGNGAGSCAAGAGLARSLGSPVTTGDCYTVGSVLDGYRGALRLMGVEPEDAVVLVLGAATAAGGLCARIMAREGVNFLTLADRDLKRLDSLVRRIMLESGVSCKVSAQPAKAAGRADLVIAAVGPGELTVQSGDFKPGAVVWDLVFTQRRFAARLAVARKDILAIEGAVVKAPGTIRPAVDFGLPPGTVYPWMAETMILALERRYEIYSSGPAVRIEKVDEIRRLAVKHGFAVEGFYSSGRCLTGAEISAVKQNAVRKMELRPV